jgi:hypothetical protein
MIPWRALKIAASAVPRLLRCSRCPPAWLASITHDPAWAKLTIPEASIEHAEFVVEASIENVTGFPDPPPDPVGVYDARHPPSRSMERTT